MSTIEIPIGNEEGKTEIGKDPTTNKDTSNKMKAADATGKKRTLIGVGILLIIVVVAVVVYLIIVLPNKNTSNGTSYNSVEGDADGVNASTTLTSTPTSMLLPDRNQPGDSATIPPTGAATKKELPIRKDPFEVEIPLFSANITEPYLSIEDARDDIEKLAKSIVNKIILDEVGSASSSWAYSDAFPSAAAPVSADAEFLAEAADDSKSSSVGDSGSAFAGADDFETYQHETGVVKNDLVKSNRVHVFAALDDSVLVWNLQGDLLETISMPEIIIPDRSDNTYNYWRPKPYIQALLMNPQGSKLAVVVDGYGMEYEPIYRPSNTDITLPIVHSYRGTRIIVYDVEGDRPTKLSQTDVNGYHVDSYAVGNNVHIVTKMSLNTYDHLTKYLQRRTFKDMTDEEYTEAAILKAKEVIPKFVDKVIDVVTVDENVILSRLAVFVDSISDSSDTYVGDLFGGGIADTITQVNSFDINAIGSEEDMKLNISKSAILQPGYSGYVYATDEWIWVTDQGWNWDREEKEYAEKTMLLGFRLNGASSTFSVVGSVPGRLLSQFSIDFVKNEDKEDGIIKEYLRIATTESFFQRGWWGPRPMPAVFIEDDNSLIEQELEKESRTKNQIIIFEVPKVDDNNRQDNTLVRLGSVKLGKKDETITAVRFFDNISYVVTFERTDPFYVLDLSDPMKPKVLGELEIPGFSQFMHPIKDDNSVLITVGQNADEEGNTLGFQISIFDSAIPTYPKLIDRFVIEDDEGRWSGSSASWDERAFRYLQVGDLGRLIIPVSIYSNWDAFGEKIGDDFEGFMVFGVDLTKTENLITREFEVDHSQNREEAYNNNGCYCGYYWLPQRSMVFNANVMTMRNQQVISTNLITRETQWNITLKDDDNCCYP